MPGNIASFDDLDMVRCFLMLDENRSREYLTKNLEIGEGSVRGILDKLKNKGLISSTRRGHTFSDAGLEWYSRIKKTIQFPIAVNSAQFFRKFFPIYTNLTGSACLLFDYYKSVSHICLYRDYAIKAGADGALMLKYDGKLCYMETDYCGNLEMIKRLLPLNRDCMVLIVVGQSKRIVEKGILNIVHNMTDIFKALK